MPEQHGPSPGSRLPSRPPRWPSPGSLSASTHCPNSPADRPKPGRARLRKLAKRLLLGIVGIAALGVAALALIPFGQRVDSSWRPTVSAPRYLTGHPTICFDEGHYNAHTAGGRYRPLADLLEADGYRVERHRGSFSEESLRSCSVLVIANAAGGDRFRIGPINLPIKRGGQRGDPAFTAAEIALLRSWVERGGSLLLIADHAPFGQASSGLAAAFGVGMGGGFVEVPPDSPANGGPGQAIFTTGNGLLRPHPITAGLHRVMTCTGQSLTGAGEPLLLLPAGAVEFVPPGPMLRPTSAAAHRQAAALGFGHGRVVVLGEAGMISAQIDSRGRPMGMNVPGNDNQAFALNLFHWLARAI